MPTSSANPNNLNTFVQRAGSDTDTLSLAVNNFVTAYDSLGPSSEATVSAGSVVSGLQAYVRDNQQAEQFVRIVRSKFIEADSNTIDDAGIAAALKAAGIGQEAPPVPTIADPTLKGLPLNSGWSNDPVCMATGHFVEPETDLAMPSSLASLAWTRTYNSQFVADGPLGLGWSSWADTSLVARDGAVEYRGPDGQAAVWLAAPDGGYLPNPGVEARLQDGPDGGLELRWAWRSRRPGCRWVFDRSGRIVTIHQPGSGVIEAGYDGSRLVRLHHGGGRSIDVRWEGTRIAEVVASDGRVVRYTYDGAALAGVDRPAGGVTYRSDDAGRILEVVDADGVRIIRNEYDPDGRVLVQESAHGRVTHFDYLGHLTVLARDDQGGPRTLFRHDSRGRLVELTTGAGTRLVREYDDAGHPVRVVGLAGDETLRRYDTAGNLIWERDPTGAERCWEHDGDGRVVAATDPAGVTRTMTYRDDDPYPTTVAGPEGWRLDLDVVDGRLAGLTDADGVTNRIVVDVDGQAVGFVDGAGRTTTIDRHPSGAVAAVTGPDGHRLLLERDDAGRLVRVVRPDGAVHGTAYTDAGRRRVLTGPDGARTELTWGDDGELAAVTDAEGGVTTLVHDVLGRLVEGCTPDGGAWQFGYDALTQLTSVTDPTGAAWEGRYDDAGHWLGLVDPTGIGVHRRVDAVGRLVGLDGPDGCRVDVERDAAGRVVGDTYNGVATTIERDALGRPTRLVDPLGHEMRLAWTPAGRLASRAVGDAVWRYRYDEAGDLAEIVLPSGQRTRYVLDAAGRRTEARTGDDDVRRYHWDADGRLEAVEGPAGDRTRWEYGPGSEVRAIVGPDGARVSAAHDRLGRVTAVTDALGATTAIERTATGHPTAVTDGKGATWRRHLDPAGRPVATTDPLGRRTDLTRDIAGRLVGRTDPDGTETTYRWDPAGLHEVRVEGTVAAATRVDPVARRIETAGPGGDGSVAWDDRGRPVERHVGGRRTGWAYDDEASTVTVTLPDGATLVRHLDAFGRADWVEHPVLGRVDAAFDDLGRLVTLRGPGLQRTWTYHGDRLVAFVEERDGRAERTELEHDRAGRVRVERRDGVERRYDYDAAGQLVAADGPDGRWSWAYDACGRMTDEDGPRGTRSFAYDAADQLVTADGPGGTVRFAYDACGRRVLETRPDRTVRYSWDALGRLATVTVSDADGERVTRLDVDGGGTLHAVDGTAVDWSGDDRRPLALGGRVLVEVGGSPVALASAGGVEPVAVDWRGTADADEHDPWGHRPSAGGGATLGFLGEVGFGSLVWLRSRVYDTAHRCFLSPDPLHGIVGAPGALTNPYTYAGNDPVQHADPLGLQPMSMAQYHDWRKEEQAGHWAEVATWAADAGIAAFCVVAIATSGGAALPLLMGMSGLLGEAGGAFDDLIHHKPISATDILWGGAAGVAVGGLGGLAGVGASALAEGAGWGVGSTYLAGLGATGVAGGMGNAGMSAAQQYVTYGHIDPGTTVFAGGMGLFAGLAPTTDVDETAANVWRTVVTPSAARLQNGVVGGYYGAFAAVGQAGTDNSGPAPGPTPPPPPNLSQPVQLFPSLPNACSLPAPAG